MSDPDELVLGRLRRLQAELARGEFAGGLFYDPINIRYATGVPNMQVYGLHNPCRYVWVPLQGQTVLFEFKGCAHLSAGAKSVGEVRDAISWYHFVAGSRAPEMVNRWADQVYGLVDTMGARIAVDRLDAPGIEALERRGVSVGDGHAVADRSKMIKTSEEITAIRSAVASADAAIATMVETMTPGRSEQEIWADLHRAAIANGAEWFETRLLTSGPRTNPWYQEAGNRVVERGDVVALDTDLIGLAGYAVDISRTWVAGGTATGQQRRLHAAAYEQIRHNIDLLQPGSSFAEVSANAKLPPPDLHSPTNACVAHGIGLCNEYPLIVNQDHFSASGYDGDVEVGMVLCVESLVAPPGGTQSVKLEEQVLIRADGPEILSTTSFDDNLK